MKLFAGILAFLFAALPAALAAEVKLEPAQQEAVNKLKAKGGLVMQLAADSDALVVGLSQAGKQANDEDLALVKALPKVVELNLAGTSVTDKGLANIAGLNTLTVLHLENTAVTDAGLPHLKGLSNLAYLNLYNTAVTDAGVAHLKELKKLKNLYLLQTKVTDAGAKDLKAAIAGIHVNRGEELAKVVIPPPEKKEEKKPEAKPAVATAKPINLKCPVSGKDVDPKFTLTHEGKVIGFCCDMCPKAFEKEPAKFAANIKADAPKEEPKKPEPKKEEKKPEPKPAVAAKPINLKCPVTGDDIDAEVTFAFQGKTVAFCCMDCRKEFEKEPAKFAAKIKADAPAAKDEKTSGDKKPTEIALVNTKCPRTGNPVVATLTAEHEGKTLGFCSTECQTKFKADPAKYLPRLVQDGPGAKK
jgi:YHS domain-containing protein